MYFKQTKRYLIELANIHRFVMRFFKEVFVRPFEFREIVKQSYEIGYKSLPLMSVTGFIIGFVFTNQSRPSLADFGAQAMLPSVIGIAVIRALAPLVTALISAGKVGSQIGAELGSMRVTEQIDAMEVSGINPFKFLVVSRVVATTIMIPVLTCYVAFVALMGGYLSVHIHESTSFNIFVFEFFHSLSYVDVLSTLIKSAIFGYTIGIVGSFQGYHSNKGTEGVGKAANWAVVMSMFLIFIEELLIAQVIQAIR